MTNLNKLLIALSLMMSFPAMAQQSDKLACSELNAPVQIEGECQYNEVVLFTGDYDNATHSWDFNGDGIYEILDTTAFKVSYTYSSTGTFTPKVLIKTEFCDGRVNEGTVKIKSIARPVFTLDESCNTFQTTNYSRDFDSMRWEMSDGAIYESMNPVHTFDYDKGTFEISLFTYKNGCRGVETKQVTFEKVTALPTISDNNICAPASIEFKNEKKQDATYTWYINDEKLGSEASFISHFEDAANGEVSLSVRNEYGCYDSSAVVEELQINERMVADFQVNKSHICLGQTIEVEDLSTGNDTREWFWGDGKNNKRKKRLDYEYATAGVYDVSLVIERRSDNCIDTLTKKAAVVVDAAPKANFALSTNEGCAPLEVDITDNNKGYFNDIQWVVNGIDTINADETYTFTKRGANEITVSLKNTKGGCQSQYSEKVRVFKPLNENVRPKVLETEMDDSLMTVSWLGLPNVAEYSIYKLDETGEVFIKNTNDTTFTTVVLNPSENTEQYAVKAIDQCESSSELSLPAQNIRLSGTYAVDSFPTLRWDESNSWERGIGHYRVEKNQGYGWETVAEVEQPHYIDRNFDNNSTLDAKYRVVAVNKSERLSSASNSWTFNFKPNIFIPNAFTPNYDNINDKFEVKGHGMSKLNIKIFNRFGQEVFDSKGENTAWDGKYRGQLVASGNYVAVINLESPSGRDYHFEETIKVIR